MHQGQLGRGQQAGAQQGFALQLAQAPGELVDQQVQLLVQLVFFLHLGRNKTARWNTLAFGTTFAGILVVVLASVWIMYHLNYNMTPTEQTNYINDQSTF